MPIPNHRADCQTRIWPAHCPECGAKVSFFSCSCGSRVFFEAEWPPFIEHWQNCPSSIIKHMLDEEQWTTDRIRQIVVDEAQSSGRLVPSDALRTLDKFTGGNRGKVISALPDEPTEVDGYIETINKNVNFYQRFKIPNNPISTGMLGILAKDTYDELIVRESTPELGVIFEFSTFIPQRLLSGKKPTAKKAISIKIKPHTAANNTIWLIHKISL